LGIDGNALLLNVVNGNSSTSLTTIQNNMTALIIFVASFAVGFLFILVLWPFLCCCCTCPYCCPSKCCQKAEDEQYSKCELYWPATILIIALLLTISASIYGFVQVSTFGPSISNLGCSIAIFSDDLLNGNSTVNGTYFFTGLNTLSAQLGNLWSNLSTINTNFADLTGTTPAPGAGNSESLLALNNVWNAANKVSQIPTGVANASLALSYMTPINSGSASVSLSSTFNSVLGSGTQSSTLVGGLYAVIGNIYSMIFNARSNATSFSGSYGGISAALSSVQSSVSSIATSMTNVDSSMSNVLSYVNKAGTNGNMGLQIFYGVLIGFSTLGLLGALLTVCCDKYGCRHLIYFSCFVLFIVGLIAALLATLFSIMLPGMTWGCSYLDTALATSSGFTTNLGTPLGSAVAGQLAPCMPFGNGNIINSIGGSATNTLNNLTSVINTMGSWNATTY
jgi:hypothetical protein